VIAQLPTAQQIIPLAGSARRRCRPRSPTNTSRRRDEILTVLSRAIWRCRSSARFWKNNASFYGAQMSAMDNATRNAGDMIRKQTPDLQPNPSGHDTKELTKSFPGAEAI